MSNFTDGQLPNVLTGVNFFQDLATKFEVDINSGD